MKTKKIISLLMVVLLCLGGIIPSVTSGEDIPSTDENTSSVFNDFEYQIIDNSYAEITSYIGTATEVVIPFEIDGYSVRSIGAETFYWCESLTSVEIPNSVTSIEGYSFSGCHSLTKIEVSADNTNYCDIDGVLFDKNKTTLVRYPEGKKDSNYIIPDSVTTIGDSAFRYCDSLTSITIGNNVTTIGECAFFWGGSFKSVVIPDSVKTIGDSAFYRCTSIESVRIGNGVTSIGDSAFGACYLLTSVTIGNSVTNIGDYAFELDVYEDLTFYGESGSYAESYAKENGIPFVAIETPQTDGDVADLSEWKYSVVDNSYVRIDEYVGTAIKVVIPNEIDGYPVTWIEEDAFFAPEDMETRVVVPNSVTVIGKGAFGGNIIICGAEGSYAEVFAYMFGIPFEITSSGDDVDHEFVYRIDAVDDVVLVDYKGNNTNVVIPSEFAGYQLTAIYREAFLYNNDVVSVEIPYGVVEIGKNAFSDCKSLERIVIPNSVTQIYHGVLENCDKVTIYGISGSRAEEYAKENDIPFIAINESAARPTPNTTVTPNTTAKPTEKPGVPKTGSTKLAVVIASILVLAAVGTTTGVLVKKED